MTDQMLAMSLALIPPQIEGVARLTSDPYIQERLTSALCALADAQAYLRTNVTTQTQPHGVASETGRPGRCAIIDLQPS